MSVKAQLFFIYDCLCPWSYAVTPLVAQVAQSLTKDVEIIYLNNAYFGGTDSPSKKQLKQVEQLSKITFANGYYNLVDKNHDSTLSANVMAWAARKEPNKTLPLLMALQEKLFQAGQPLNLDTVTETLDQLKLFAPSKALKENNLSKDAQFDLGEIDEIQEIIGTRAIPALLLAVGDNLILLNHNLYLLQPQAIVEAINIELNKA
jgi:protein-disulfide isomerase-like protein with CxxC motif